MDNSNPPRTGGQPRAFRGARSPARPDGRGPLVGAARRAFEKEILGRPGLKGSRLSVLRTLLDDFCWGKPSCWPGNARIAQAAGLSVSTVKRCLHDLESLGIIRILTGGDRRRIVLVDHPHAAELLDGQGNCQRQAVETPGSERSTTLAHPDPPGGFRLSPESLIRSTAEVETPPDPRAGEGEISLPGSNDRTSPMPGELPDAGPTPVPAPAAPSRRRGFADWSAAPTDDPVIAAELRRRAEAKQSAAAMPTAAEILDTVLGTVGTPRDGRGEAGDGGEVSAVAAALASPCETSGPPAAGADRHVEREVIRALSAVGPGATAKEVTVATLRLAGLFGDTKSLRYYRGVVNDVARGELPAHVPIAAVEWARRPGVVKPAAAFTGHVERCRRVAGQRRG